MIENGGILGKKTTVSPVKANGIWTLKEQVENNKEKYWPRNYNIPTWSNNFSMGLVDGSVSLPSGTTYTAGVYLRNDGLKLYTTDSVNNRINEYNLTTAWDISTLVFVVFYTIPTYEATATYSVSFNETGTLMYVLGDTYDGVYCYKLSTAWSISTATPVGKRTYSASGATFSSADGVTFKSDGTKMYACDGNTTIRRIYEYNLTTPWDVTTATTTTNIQIAYTPKSVRFNDVGTRMYIQTDSFLYEYVLPTPWSVVGAVLASDYIKTTTYETSPSGIRFNPDGTKMYIIGYGTDSIYQYTLSTPWDVYTAGTPTSKSVAAQATAPNGFTFGNNGLNLYVVDDTTNSIFSYSLSVAYDISSTLTYINSFVVTTQTGTPDGIAFNDTGTRMFITNQSTTVVWGYTLSTAWNVATATTPVSRSIANVATDLFFNSTGTKLWIVIPTTGVNIYEYTVSPAWTGTLTQVTSYTTGKTEYGLAFSADGTKFYCVDTSSDIISTYYMSTAFSVSTANPRGRFSTGTYLATCNGLTFNADGTKLFFSNASTIGEATLGEAWNIGTAIYNRNVSVSAQESGMTECFITNNGSTLYMTGSSLGRLYQYTLNTPNTLAGGLTYVGYLDVYSSTRSMTGVYVKPDGTEFYIMGNGADAAFYSGKFNTPWSTSTAGLYFVLGLTALFANDNSYAMSFGLNGTRLFVVGYNIIYQLNLSVAYDITTASYSGISYNATTPISQTYLNGVTFDSTGTYMYVTAGTSSLIYKFTLTTPWSLATVTYNTSYDTYEPSLKDLHMRSNDLEFYVFSDSTDRLNKIKLMFANDITNPVTYDNKIFTMNSQGTMTDIAFDSDNKVLFAAANNDYIYQYELTTPNDITTAVYTNKSYLTTSQGGTNLYSVFVDPNSKYLYTNNTSRLYQYNFQRRNDLTDMLYSNKTSPNTLSSENFHISPNGAKLFWSINGTNDYIYEYALSIPWDISTQSAALNTFIITTFESTVRAVCFNMSGTQMYVMGSTGYITIFNLKTPWSLTNAYYAGKNYVGSIVSGPYGMRISNDGTKLYVSNNSTVYQFSIRNNQ